MIADLNPGDRFDDRVLVSSCTVRLTKRQKEYFAMEVRDASALVQVRMWDPPAGPPPASGIVIRMIASVEEYNGEIQLKAEKILGVNPKDYNPEDFLPHAARPAAEMHAELSELITADVKDEKLKALLLMLITEPNIKPKLLRAPAASRYHHAFLGGLLEHVLSLWKAAKGLHPCYPWASLDIVLCACVCHDIGKIIEYQTDVNIDFSSFGRLVGHILIGARITSAYASKLKIPDGVVGQILHCIASHHGDEFAEVKMQTPEAVMFHYLDELDSRMGGIKPVWDAADPADDFTARVPILGRPVYKGVKSVPA